MNKRNHSFIMESKLSDVRGRVDYISSPERQEHLYAVYSDVQDHYWELLAEQNQKDFLKSGTKGTCIEGRELIIMLPPSLMGYDHDLLLKYIRDRAVFQFWKGAIFAITILFEKVMYKARICII